uniref:Cytochrome P450 n=1 Tax=Oryza meridionalis TaxID=40149 RepID=A0A0E0EAA2_9ORYZ
MHPPLHIVEVQPALQQAKPPWLPSFSPASYYHGNHLFTAVLFLLLPLVYLLFFKGDGKGGVMDSASAPSPPGPHRQLPVLGNLLQIGSRPHRYFQAVARRYGPVVQVQLGSIRTVVVHSPEAAKDVLRTNDLQCCSRPSSPGKRSKPIYICTWLGYCQQPKFWVTPSCSPHLHARCQAIHRRGPPLLLSSRGYPAIIIPLLAQGVAGGRMSEDWPPLPPCSHPTITVARGESGVERPREMDENG